MSGCPLSALADIATQYASTSPPPATSPSSVCGTHSSPCYNGGGAHAPSASPSLTSPSAYVVNQPTAAKNLKKRSVHAYCDDEAPSTESKSPNKKSSKKVKKKKKKKKDNNKSSLATQAHTSSSSVNNKTARICQWLMNPSQLNDRPSFPTILMGILSAPQNNEYITFLSDEQNFIIINSDEMERKVLPMYFEHNVPSCDEFMHLLTLWGFEVAQEEQYPHVQLYKHPKFRKGDWEACLSMTLPGNVKQPHSVASSSRPLKKRKTVHKKSKSSSPHQHSTAPASPHHGTRSVTPPEFILDNGSGLLPYQAIAQTLPEESAAEFLAQSAMLESMIAATAETRRRLSVSVDGPPSSTLMGLTRNYSELMYPQTLRGPSQQGISRQTSFTSTSDGGESCASSQLSDAEVSKMTSDVVTAAMAALKGSETPKMISSTSRLKSIISSTPASSSLNAITEAFIQRSNARRMQSRPAGIYGARGQSSHATMAKLSSQFSDSVDAQTKALLNNHGSRYHLCL